MSAAARSWPSSRSRPLTRRAKAPASAGPARSSGASASNARSTRCTEYLPGVFAAQDRAASSATTSMCSASAAAHRAIANVRSSAAATASTTAASAAPCSRSAGDVTFESRSESPKQPRRASTISYAWRCLAAARVQAPANTVGSHTMKNFGAEPPMPAERSTAQTRPPAAALIASLSRTCSEAPVPSIARSHAASEADGMAPVLRAPARSGQGGQGRGCPVSADVTAAGG